ncbi:class I SAM-dependent methyltransferase [Aquibaculum arenosum]|uniref:Class I SAM-dependent methyltransferase n=1 Tax=Aquibaculum arenosum TaxID=3032591 RepID=A0ABT5YK07_9PROT|nr:class I SAM-dependent methyltransferase [Fodinicurvata sp. CAU 1616]MDF2095281.1 class I SAM-dependent methyltransferase [Fodinicurvata sp. CAU 1616]
MTSPKLSGFHSPDSVPTCCPVCLAPNPEPFLEVEEKHYWCCGLCEARFLDPSLRLSAREEHVFYLTHENNSGDAGYRRFLAKLAIPLLARLPASSNGLDYGCGPASALAAMLREAGHAVALYDPFFRPNTDDLAGTYDFVTCTETAEHFHRPAEEFARLMALVRPGGWLGLMTCFQTDDARFADWHYRRDPTHVVFYREETLRYLAASRGWSIDVPVKDVALLRRPISPSTPY